MQTKSLQAIIFIVTVSVFLVSCVPGKSVTQAIPPTDSPLPNKSSPSNLENTLWSLDQYADGQGNLQQVIPGSEATADFKADKIGGNASCNSFSGSYSTDGQSVVFGPLASTMMYCAEPEGLMDQEAAYLAALGSAARYQNDDDKLTIFNSEGQKLLIYQPMLVPVSTQSIQPQETLDDQAIMNAEYASEFTASGTAKLVDGEYSEPAAPGSASQVIVQITTISYGNLADGRPAAAVIHATNAGGSGTFYALSVVLVVNGEPSEIAAIPLGDRINLNSISWDEGEVFLDLITQGPDDPMCCPTQREIRRYALVNNALFEIDRQVVVTSEPGLTTNVGPDLVGVTWQWMQFQEANDNLTIPGDPAKYTLEFQADGSINILADCNGGSGAYTADESLLSIRITRMTMAACPPDSLSDEYVRLLNDAVSYLFEDGDLYIAIKHDTGIMHFAPAQ